MIALRIKHQFTAGCDNGRIGFGVKYPPNVVTTVTSRAVQARPVPVKIVDDYFVAMRSTVLCMRVIFW